MLDRRSQEVTLTNFCLGKHLMRDDDLLKDQRGSPAYISPDVLSGKPYLGKLVKLGSPRPGSPFYLTCFFFNCLKKLQIFQLLDKLNRTKIRYFASIY